MTKEGYWRSRPLAGWVLLAWLIIFTLLGLEFDPAYWLGLMIPLYWQVYLKEKFAPSWW